MAVCVAANCVHKTGQCSVLRCIREPAFGPAMAAHALLCVLLLALTACSALPSVHSQRAPDPAYDASVLRVSSISFADLTDASRFYASRSDNVLRQSMTEVGVIAVSAIPGFAQLRRDVLVASRGCGVAASAAQSTTFPDGTVRRTIATTTKGLHEHSKMELGNIAQGATCPVDFTTKADQFRSLVSETAEAFTRRMGELFTPAGRPFLYNMEHSKKFASFEEIASAAEHLEHFHAYSRLSQDAAATAIKDGSTIDMHADQGIFIAFTPGLMVDQPSDGFARVTGSSPGTFYVERRNGSRAVADFGPTGDVLVFLLGDGVDQYINPYLTQGPVLRAAPHAMVMPRHAPTEARVWYGRMFLPPSEALSEPAGISFGDLRARAIGEIHEGLGVGSTVGCSRQLLATESPHCEANQIYCWMRCMDYTEEASPEVCAAKNLSVKCASQRDEIWTLADSHGDYNPTCTNSTAPITPLPTIPARPATCTGFEDFLGKEEYANSQELAPGTLYLLWNVSDGQLHGKMVYNGVAGWLAFGLAGTDGHGGMNGARIVMAINDPDEALCEENNTPFIGTSVNEFIIDQELTAFRHWQTPYLPKSLSNSSITVTQCHTAMTFSTDSMADWPVELDSNNSFIWGMHNDTYLKGYHAYGMRGQLLIDLSQPYGHQTLSDAVSTPPPPSVSPPPGSPSSATALLPFGSGAFSVVVLLALAMLGGTLYS